MKFLRVPPAEGVAWVRRAFQIFWKQPMGFAALFAACALVFYAFLAIPFVGGFLLLLLAPAGTLLFMVATRQSLDGQRPMPGAIRVLATADRSRQMGVLKLGVAYLAVALLAFWIIAAVDGGALGVLLDSASDPKTTPEATAMRMADPRLQAGVLLRLVLGALLSVPFWHAPALVFWGGQGWAKSLFFSTVAVWRNKGAFTAYGLAWAALMIVLAMALGMIVAIVGPQAVTFVATPMVLFVTTVFYASLWFTFAGCFAEADEAPAPIAAS
jgi:hypothetical protein